jgi:chemotaxis methyl-accepting protein methylase
MAGLELEQLTESQFKKISKFVYDRTGIYLGDEKLSLLSNRLRKRVRALSLDGFDAYYALLATGDDEEMTHFLSAVTTNETYFFRNDRLWDYIRDELVPALKAEKEKGATRTLRFWSAASSTGAEAYTLAIVLKDALKGGWDAKIIGSDISERVLNMAREAVYDSYAVNRIEANKRRAYFKHDKETDRYHLREEIRDMVRFEFHNLRDPYRKMQFDVVFLRNVMMYFDLPMKRRVLANVENAIRPGGYLVIGDVDPMRDGSGLRDDCTLEYVRPSLYRKPA